VEVLIERRPKFDEMKTFSWCCDGLLSLAVLGRTPEATGGRAVHQHASHAALMMAVTCPHPSQTPW
jgi:hypothetical protein